MEYQALCYASRLWRFITILPIFCGKSKGQPTNVSLCLSLGLTYRKKVMSLSSSFILVSVHGKTRVQATFWFPSAFIPVTRKKIYYVLMTWLRKDQRIWIFSARFDVFHSPRLKRPLMNCVGPPGDDLEVTKARGSDLHLWHLLINLNKFQNQHPLITLKNRKIPILKTLSTDIFS